MTAKQMNTASTCRRRLIVDTDVAFDDLVALSILLADRRRSNDDRDENTDNDILVTTVDGGNSARGGYVGLKRLFPKLDVLQGFSSTGGIPLEPWVADFRSRFSDFCNRWCDDERDVTSSAQSQQLRSTSDAPFSHLKQYLYNTPEGESVDLICLGPLTNVAQWTMMPDLEELLLQKVGSIWILGGNVNSEDDEFNFGQDPKASASIFHNARLRECGIQIYLVPGDETSGENYLNKDPTYIDTVVQVAQTCSQKNLIAQLLIEESRFAMFFDPVLCFLYDESHHQHQTLPLDNGNNAVVEWVPRDFEVNSETGQVHAIASADTSMTSPSITPCLVARRVNFLAYQSWLLQCLRGEPTADDN